MKVLFLITFLIIFQNSFAQGPENTKDSFSIDAVLTGFSKAIEGYDVRGSFKVNDLDKVNSNFTESYLDLIIKLKSSFSTDIVKFDNGALKPFNQQLFIGEKDLLKILNITIKAQIPYENSKKFILDNSYISPRFFGFYNENLFNPDYLAKRDQLDPDEKPMTPQFITANLRFSKETEKGTYKDHHLKVIVKSPINVEEYQLTNCKMMGLLLPANMHLFYKLECDYKLTTGNYNGLIGNGIKEGATIKGFVDLNGELDPALYESNFSL